MTRNSTSHRSSKGTRRRPTGTEDDVNTNNNVYPSLQSGDITYYVKPVRLYSVNKEDLEKHPELHNAMFLLTETIQENASRKCFLVYAKTTADDRIEFKTKALQLLAERQIELEMPYSIYGPAFRVNLAGATFSR